MGVRNGGENIRGNGDFREFAAFLAVTAVCFLFVAAAVSWIEDGSLGEGIKTRGDTVSLTLTANIEDRQTPQAHEEPPKPHAEDRAQDAPATPLLDAATSAAPPRPEITEPQTTQPAASDRALPPEAAGRTATRRQAAAAAGGGASRSFERTLLRHLKSFQRSPPSSLSASRLVLLRIVLQRSGRVGDIELLQSSGDASLDAEAIATVRRAQPLPPIPFDLPNRLTISIPFDFS